MAVSLGLTNFAALVGIGFSGIDAQTWLWAGVIFGVFEKLSDSDHRRHAVDLGKTSSGTLTAVGRSGTAVPGRKPVFARIATLISESFSSFSSRCQYWAGSRVKSVRSRV